MGIDVSSGIVHGFHHPIEGDLAGTGQEIGKGKSVQRPHGGHGVPLDAGNLNQSANRIAGQAQMML